MVFKNSLNSFSKKHLLISIITMILYATISYALDGEKSGIVEDESFGDFRPAIFFPAIVAILYGPVVGGISAGFGNLLYDALRHEPISPGGGPLDYANLFGAIGNMIGGIIVGGLSKPYKNTQTMFDYSDEVPDKYTDVFDFEYLRRLIRNTIAAIVGLAFVNSFIIGYGQRLIESYDPSNSQPFFIAVSSSNGIVLLITTPLTLFTISTFEWISGKKSKKRLEERRVLTYNNLVGVGFELTSALSPRGDELAQHSWGAANFKIKNISEQPQKYYVRIVSDDIFSPHRHKTPILKPGEEDSMYFNVYSIAHGQKKARMIVQVENETSKEHTVQIGYEVTSSYELIIDRLMNFSLVIGFLISIALVAVNIRESFRFDSSVKIALIALPLEIIIVLLVYFIKNLTVTKRIMGFMGIFESHNVETKIATQVDEHTPDKKVRRINTFRFLSRLILLISIPLFVALFIALISLDRDLYEIPNTDYVIYGFGALLILMLLSEIFLESADFSEAEILDKQALRLKVVRSAISDKQLVKFESTKMAVEIFNPFQTRGMRVFLHSIDNVSPRSIILDTQPGEIQPIFFNYTPLQNGTREVGLEFVQYRDFDGSIIPPEEAETFDQESLRLNVSNTRTFGLSPEQMNILKNTVAGIGAVTIALSFIATYFQFTIDQATLQATLPLIILLQSPVIYLILYFRNKLSTTFQSEE